MEKKIRGCPSWKTSSTAVMDKTAPNDTMPAAQFSPSCEKAAPGDPRPQVIPGHDAGQYSSGGDINNGNDDQRTDDADRHITTGLRHSSAVVEMASKPMKAKKIKLAPVQTPAKPLA